VISGAVEPISRHFELNGVSGSLRLGWAVSCLGWGAMAGNLMAGVPTIASPTRRAVVDGLCCSWSRPSGGICHELWHVRQRTQCGGLAGRRGDTHGSVYIAGNRPAAARRSGRTRWYRSTSDDLIGISVSYFSNYFLVGLGPDNWRWMLACRPCRRWRFLLLLFTVPESPRWLLTRAAMRRLVVLTSLHGESAASREIVEIQNSLKAGSRHVPRCTEPTSPVRTVVRSGIAFFQQITGIRRESSIYLADHLRARPAAASHGYGQRRWSRGQRRHDHCRVSGSSIALAPAPCSSPACRDGVGAV